MTDVMMTTHTDSTPTTGSPSDRPWQFTLRQAAIGTIVLSFVMALVFQWGLAGLIIVVAVTAIFAMCWGAYWGDWWFGGGLALLALDAFFLLPISMARAQAEAQREWRCRSNLKSIGMALHMYHDDYGSFPPAYVADASGKPMHSWRVLILPYLDRDGLYARYNFNEPWDGPNNRLLAANAPREYRCPCCSESQSHSHTNYLAVVGSATAWPGAKGRALADFADGTSSTLLIAESHSVRVVWTAPVDLASASMSKRLNPQQGNGISSPHRHGESHWGNALMADGAVYQLDETITPQDVNGLLTVAGGEKVDLP